jgi:hypothetical protein
MTGTEWRDATDPATMFLELDQHTSERKLRLFACACCRHLGPLLSEEDLELLGAAERFADGTISFKELGEIGQRYSHGAIPYRPQTSRAALAIGELASSAAWFCARRARAFVVDILRQSGLSSREAEWRRQSALLRCVFDSPYHVPDWDPSCLTWNGGIVADLATTIYDGRAFDRLPLLADALEDAGCNDRELIGHLRQPEPHCRGCWPLDLLLGKE